MHTRESRDVIEMMWWFDAEANHLGLACLDRHNSTDKYIQDYMFDVLCQHKCDQQTAIILRITTATEKLN